MTDEQTTQEWTCDICRMQGSEHFIEAHQGIYPTHSMTRTR